MAGYLQVTTATLWERPTSSCGQLSYEKAVSLSPRNDTPPSITGFYEQMLEDLEVTAGARELVEALGDRRYRLGVATSSQPWMVDRILRQTSLGGHFQVVVTAADVERPKPAPDAYQQALERLGVMAADATVIEDSETGLTAAVAAGIPTLARRHEMNQRHDLTKAEVVLDSLRQTDQILQWIDELGSRASA